MCSNVQIRTFFFQKSNILRNENPLGGLVGVEFELFVLEIPPLSAERAERFSSSDHTIVLICFHNHGVAIIISYII